MKYWIIFAFTVLALQFTVLFGPPYVPTLRQQRKKALKLLDLKPGQILIDLGCGDGSLLKEAADKGIICIGYELNPILAFITKIRTWRYRSLVTIKVKNFWQADLRQADGIYVFLAGKYMNKLDIYLSKNLNKRPVKVVSYGFQIPNRSPKSKSNGFFLYQYPE